MAVLLHAKELTLEETIDKTLKNHPDIKKLSLSISSAASFVDIAKADNLPQLSIGAQYNPISTFTQQLGGKLQVLHDDSWQADIVLNQKIYDFSKTDSTIKAYKKEQNIATLSLEDAKALLIYNIKNIYNLALLQTKAIEVRQKDVETKDALYKQADALVKEGLKTAADASSMLSALYNAKDTLVTTQADLQKSLSTLSLYMGEQIPADTKLKESHEYSEDKNLSFENLEAKNLSLKSSLAEIEKSDLLYDATKALHYGSIDAFASYSHQNTFTDYETQSAGVNVRIPIYSGGRTSAQVEQARIAKEMAKESYNSKKLLIQTELDSLNIDLERYKHTIKAKESLMESSNATKEIVYARYKEGLSTYIEVLDATSTNLQAELGLLETKYAIQKTLHRLEYLQGEIK